MFDLPSQRGEMDAVGAAREEIEQRLGDVAGPAEPVAYAVAPALFVGDLAQDTFGVLVGVRQTEPAGGPATHELNDHRVAVDGSAGGPLP